MTENQMTCGEAIIRLLEKYGVDTVFGIPGAHTIELYRGLAASPIQHVLTRHEQGAGFMADGYARVTGRPGVCLLITGPGVTNAATPIAHSFADSVPMLVISSDSRSDSLGKGWGMLHEITSQQALTEPITALSATARTPADIPELIGQAFSIFASERPRPVHLNIPIDLFPMIVSEEWEPIIPPTRPTPLRDSIMRAIDLLQSAERPLICIGGGAIGTDTEAALTVIAERLDAAVLTSNAGKGAIRYDHPLHLGPILWRPGATDFLEKSDVLFVVGSGLSETDSFVKDPLPLNGQIIRVDLDPRQINNRYPAEIGIVADAEATLVQLAAELNTQHIDIARPAYRDEITQLKRNAYAPQSDLEKQHMAVLNQIREVLPAEGVLIGDMSQIVYTGCFAFPVDRPRAWHYAGGFCTLGCALPMGIGAKLAEPNHPVVVLAGDFGFQFTLQELMVATELGIGLPVIIWNNDALGEIKDGMISANVDPVGVTLRNPDLSLLAGGFGCNYARPASFDELSDAITAAFNHSAPTLIEIRENSPFLMESG